MGVGGDVPPCSVDVWLGNAFPGQEQKLDWGEPKSRPRLLDLQGAPETLHSQQTAGPGTLAERGLAYFSPLPKASIPSAVSLLRGHHCLNTSADVGQLSSFLPGPENGWPRLRLGATHSLPNLLISVQWATVPVWEPPTPTGLPQQPSPWLHVKFHPHSFFLPCFSSCHFPPSKSCLCI